MRFTADSFRITDWGRRVFDAHDKLEAVGHTVRARISDAGDAEFLIDERRLITAAELVAEADRIKPQ